MPRSPDGEHGSHYSKADADSIGEIVTTVPVIEEEVWIAKNRVETGKVRIEKRVVTEIAEFAENLSSTSISIERVPLDLTSDDLPKIRREGDTTIIPVVEEVIEIKKHYHVTEEIHVKQITSQQTKAIEVELKKEQVHVLRE